MPTRRQSSDSTEFRQEAFASAIEHERGVLGNLVAARCQKLTDPATISVLWWLQQVSWRDGGLQKLAAEILAENPLIIGTASMHKFGRAPDTIYNADQVRLIRAEIQLPHGQRGRDAFLLRGENSLSEQMAAGARMRLGEDPNLCSGEHRPMRYPVGRFIRACEIDAEALAAQLQRWLVDPSTDPTTSLWNVPELWRVLVARREKEAAGARARLVETEITRRVFEELDFALEARTFVLIEGREGIGKSEAARAWCDNRPGRAIYVRLESGSDETTLFRSIARRIGTACSYQRKAVEMRARIQDALQVGQMMLVLDEAHFLWPQSERSERAVPKRLDWLRTALIDFGVPVALISTPQFFKRQCARFRKAGWNSLQIERRLARTTALPEPDSMPQADVIAVAQHYFPEADRRTLKRIAALALATVQFLTAIKHLRLRVDFVATRRPDVARATLIEDELRSAGLPLPEPRDVSPAPQASLKAPLNGRSDPLPDALRKRGAPSPSLVVSPETASV